MFKKPGSKEIVTCQSKDDKVIRIQSNRHRLNIKNIKRSLECYKRNPESLQGCFHKGDINKNVCSCLHSESRDGRTDPP